MGVKRVGVLWKLTVSVPSTILTLDTGTFDATYVRVDDALRAHQAQNDRTTAKEPQPAGPRIRAKKGIVIRGSR